jgi:hypothetical protein
VCVSPVYVFARLCESELDMLLSFDCILLFLKHGMLCPFLDGQRAGPTALDWLLAHLSSHMGCHGHILLAD